MTDDYLAIHELRFKDQHLSMRDDIPEEKDDKEIRENEEPPEI